MKIKILEVYEEKNSLRVKVETPYGVENFGLGIHNKYLDPDTEKPKWLKEVRKLLDLKYGKKELRQKVQLVEADSYINQTFDLEDLAPQDEEIMENERRREEELKILKIIKL